MPGYHASVPPVKEGSPTSRPATDAGARRPVHSRLRHPSVASVTPPPRDAGHDLTADWSALMARAQDGEALTYREVLESITPALST